MDFIQICALIISGCNGEKNCQNQSTETEDNAIMKVQFFFFGGGYIEYSVYRTSNVTCKLL